MGYIDYYIKYENLRRNKKNLKYVSKKNLYELYCELVDVLRDYEEESLQVALKGRKSEPHLVYVYDDSDFYGNIGKETSQVDILGNEMKIGDTVNLYNRKRLDGEVPVLYNGIIKREFINGKCDDWTIMKNRSYKDIQDGEVVADIKYIKNIRK